MFTFVFCWVPTVLKTAPSSHLDIVDGSEVSPSSPPLGLIFAAFMLCITLGGMSFMPLQATLGVEWATALICAASSASMVVPVLTETFAYVLTSFLVLEACIGCWGACSANLRSKYVDEGLQSSIMTIFRIPLNIFVVIGTKMEEMLPLHVVFLTCCAWFGVAFLLQATLAVRASGQEKAKTS